MAGVAAGVVTAGDVSSQPAPPSNSRWQNPATWSVIWAAGAAAYLLGVYLGMISLVRRGGE